MVKKIIFCALVAALVVVSCDDSPKESTWDTISPLHGIYTDKFLIGNIISPSDLGGGVRFNILERHFNSVTAENHMKPDFIAPLSKPSSEDWTDSYRFTDADAIVDAALAAGMKVHGHTLIWFDQTPSWLTSGTKEQVLANLEKYVTDVVTHFKGRVTSWDVVNEAIKPTDQLNLITAAKWEDCLRTGGWNVIGPEHIEKAFLAARAADPDAILYYNDFNMNNTGATASTLDTFANPKALAVYNMIKEINENYEGEGGRLLIEGIGMQSHHHLNTTPESVESSIKMFSELGLDIHPSELDIIAADGTTSLGETFSGFGAWGTANAQKQAERYALFFEVFEKYSDNISRVTFWGLDDGTSWRDAAHPTLLDKDYGLKPAFFAVRNPDAYLP